MRLKALKVQRGLRPTGHDADQPRARTARGERTRKSILRAAEHVFGQSGYYAASIADITRRAKVAQGTFYLYFPSKLAVFVELFDQLGHEMRMKMHEATAIDSDRLGKERGGLAAFLDYVAEHPQLYRIAREAEFVVPETWYKWYDRIIEPYESGLREAMVKKEIRPLDPTLTAYALIGLGDFVGVQLVLRRGLRKVPDSVLDAVVGFIANGLLGPNSDG